MRTSAADHDFTPVAMVTPVGIFLPSSDELFLYGVTSKVTSDCLVDRLIDWWESVKARFTHITTLLINLDNGPESHSRRTQFMHRLVEFAQRSHLTIRLAYYPPYHSEVQPNRALLGNFGTTLEWCLVGFARCRDPVCSYHDLERQAAFGHLGDHHVSDRGQTHQESDAGCRNPASAITAPGQVVRGHCLSLTICPGWLIILASLKLSPGQSAELLVAYILIPEIELMTDRQRYTCLELHAQGGLYRYESMESDFKAELPVDSDGLVIDYPGLFKSIWRSEVTT